VAQLDYRDNGARRSQAERYVEEQPTDVRVIPRKRFVEEFGKNYQPGQHVTFLGPSGRGKTRLAVELLMSVRKHHDEIRFAALHGKIKGRDLTIENLSKRTGAPMVTRWPPQGIRARYRARKYHGAILRPLTKPLDNPDEENQLLKGEYRKAIHASYHAPKKKPVILLVDEAHQTHTDLGLRKDCEGPLMRGRPVCGEWSLVQRGRYVSYHVYDQAEHVFMFYDPDRNNQERYSEIGDVDPRQLVALSRQLKTETVKDGSTISEALYFRRSGNQLAIVGI
jgi:energy-coupling factor transporter ATP-binding protein EcfA2